MKELRIAIYMFLLLMLLSCEKDEHEFIGIHDEWEWIESVGGIGGWTLTPDSEKVSRKLVIDDFWYREFENDSLILETEYDLKIVMDTLQEIEKRTFIEFDIGWKKEIFIEKNELKLIDQYDDGFRHRYRRK